MQDTIFAYTPPGGNPPFVNIRNDKDGRIILSVRGGLPVSHSDAHAVAPHAEIELPLDELAKMAVAMIGRATGGKTPILMLPTETPPSVAKALNTTLAAFWPVAQEVLAMQVAMQYREPQEAAPLTPIVRPGDGVKRTEIVDVQPERMDEIVEEPEEEPEALDTLAAIPSDRLNTLTEQEPADVEPAAAEEV